jgi:hypothetical protein
MLLPYSWLNWVKMSRIRKRFVCTLDIRERGDAGVRSGPAGAANIL